ncbi:MAG: urease accessory protein UreF [Deltaproteobacteria bacterium]|nr:urease accessory protein UreF [Deltaproteobacteria bacterium]
MLRLLQLVSPTLPVGAYAYSQALEWAAGQGWIRGEAEAADWIIGLMQHTLVRFDVPLLVRFHHAWDRDDQTAVRYWNAYLLAGRESAEFQAQENHLGRALATLLANLGLTEAELWKSNASVSFLNMFALAAVRWDIPIREAGLGYLWSWAENQVAAAIKLIPLGQTAGQRILGRCVEVIPEIVIQADTLADDEIGFTAPSLAIAGALHETQHTRLFRS